MLLDFDLCICGVIFCRISFSNVSLMFLWFWHAHLAFCQWYVILRILTWSLLQNEMRKQIVQNIGCTKLEWGQGSTVYSIFQQCHFINNFVVYFFQTRLLEMNVCCIIVSSCFFVKSMHQLESIKWFFVVKNPKKGGQESQNSFYKLLSVVFVKSMHKLESIKWFFVVNNQKNWGQESQNSFYKLLSVVFVKSMHQLESIK